MALFVIPIATSAIPSVLFKLSELALAFIATQILAIAFSWRNDFENYAILQCPVPRQVIISFKIARSGRFGRALAILTIMAILVIITFYNTLLWSLIDLSGPLRVAKLETGLDLNDFYSGKFWALDVNVSSTQDELISQIVPGIGSGYFILSNPQAFRFEPNAAP
jgi:hypothetical protein